MGPLWSVGPGIDRRSTHVMEVPVSGLFGFISNSAEIGAAALEASVGSLDLGRAESLLRWGIGFHHEGEVLLRRHPADARSALPMRQVLGEVRAVSLIGHFGKAPAGARRTEDTYPCRYRNWLYAHCGPVDSSEEFRSALRASLPEFLAANLQADTSNELLFRLFLSCLHDAGGLLDGRATAAHARDAIRAYLAAIRRIAARLGLAAPPLNLLAGNGEFLVVARTGGRIAFRSLEGPRELDLVLGDRAERAPMSSRVPPRVGLIFSDPARAAGRFVDVAPQTLLVLGPDGPPVSATLDLVGVSRAA